MDGLYSTLYAVRCRALGVRCSDYYTPTHLQIFPPNTTIPPTEGVYGVVGGYGREGIDK